MADSPFATTNPIPAILTNARVYREGADQIGVGSVELPPLEMMSETISGLAIAGEVDMPVTGHFGSQEMTIKWNAPCPDAVSLLKNEAHHLDIRASIQGYDAGSGLMQDVPVKAVVRALPKSVSFGAFEPAKKSESETKLQVTYIKIWIGGVERVEIDKFNFIFRVDGVDQLATVRSNLGL